MSKFVRSFFAAALLCAVATAASAQPLPVAVEVSGNTANVRIGLAGAPLADLRLDFDDASGLSAAALGISAELVNIGHSGLLARLPDPLAVGIPASLPLLITVEPPLLGGLSFRRQVHVELHTHALAYTAGSRYRLLKAPLGGQFRDITGEVAPGSVRTRGTTGGWSQVLVVLDLRPTDTVVAEKIDYLRTQIAMLSAIEATPLTAELNAVETAVADQRYAAASTGIDAMRARVSARAGTGIPDQWRATRDLNNLAGELQSGLDTLDFSIGFLRDHGL